MTTSGTSGEGRTGKTGRRLEETFRDFWATRPQRPMVGRKFAGVAAAIANRYAIDPTLVRVAFVTLALFGGSGLVFYLLGWLFLAQQGDHHSAFGSMVGRGPSSVSTVFSLLLCVVLVVSTGTMLGGNFMFGSALSGPIGFAALVVALYLLHSSRAGSAIEPAPLSQRSPATAAAEAPGPDWDPLGAAPFTWELPEPAAAPPERPARPPRCKSRIGLAGWMAALLALAACVLLAPAAGGWLSVPHILGVALAVTGLAMVAAAFRRRGRSLILLAVLLACGALAAMRGGDAGERTARAPASIGAVAPHYENRWGSLRLDLTRLPAKGTVRTSVNNEFGRSVVVLPRTADVTVDCHSRFGSADCLGASSGGVDATPTRRHDDGPDGRGGLRVDLDAGTRFGTLEVRRG